MRIEADMRKPGVAVVATIETEEDRRWQAIVARDGQQVPVASIAFDVSASSLGLVLVAQSASGENALCAARSPAIAGESRGNASCSRGRQ